jgi:hypothetical protein
VSVPQFSSDSAPLELKWDGTVQIRNETSGETEDRLATSGYYFLYPKLLVAGGDTAVYPRVDRSSIFYLESLNVSMDFTYQESTRNLTLGLGDIGPIRKNAGRHPGVLSAP